MEVMETPKQLVWLDVSFNHLTKIDKVCEYVENLTQVCGQGISFWAKQSRRQIDGQWLENFKNLNGFCLKKIYFFNTLYNCRHKIFSRSGNEWRGVPVVTAIVGSGLVNDLVDELVNRQDLDYGQNFWNCGSINSPDYFLSRRFWYSTAGRNGTIKKLWTMEHHAPWNVS